MEWMFFILFGLVLLAPLGLLIAGLIIGGRGFKENHFGSSTAAEHSQQQMLQELLKQFRLKNISKDKNRR